MYFQSVSIRFKKRFIIPLLICFFCKLQAQPNEEQTYRNLKKALENPKDVRVLNLNGNQRITLPKEIKQLQNLTRVIFA